MRESVDSPSVKKIEGLYVWSRSGSDRDKRGPVVVPGLSFLVTLDPLT
jgi:hypothetical protein